MALCVCVCSTSLRGISHEVWQNFCANMIRFRFFAILMGLNGLIPIDLIAPAVVVLLRMVCSLTSRIDALEARGHGHSLPRPMSLGPELAKGRPGLVRPTAPRPLGRDKRHRWPGPIIRSAGSTPRLR